MLLMEEMGDQQLYWQRGKSVTVSGGLTLVYWSSPCECLAALLVNVPVRGRVWISKGGKNVKKKTPEVLKYVRFGLLWLKRLG